MKTPVHWPPTTELLYRQPDGTVVKAAEAEQVLADEMASEVDAILEEAYEEALQDALEETYEEAYEIAYEDAYRKAKKVAERKAAGQCADESEVEEAEEEAGENLRENARVNVREEAREGVGEETRDDAHEEAEAHATIEQPQDDNPQPVADGIHHILRAGNCPLDIGLWREILFKLETPIELTVQQFELVWPYMTNCWSFNSNSYQYGDHFLYRCVFGAKGRGTAGYGVRAKKRRAVNGCPTYLKMIPQYVGEPRRVVGYVLQRLKSPHNDDHTLDTADMARMNTTLVDMVAYQLSLGKSVGDVRDLMRAKHDPVAERHFLDAGGRKMDYQVVANILRHPKR
jgi:hypothetical protein